jgi:hypothetical protein
MTLQLSVALRLWYVKQMDNTITAVTLDAMPGHGSQPLYTICLLVELRLGTECYIDDGTVADIVAHLQQDDTLRVLDLNNANIGFLTFNAVAEYLCRKSPSE